MFGPASSPNTEAVNGSKRARRLLIKPIICLPISESLLSFLGTFSLHQESSFLCIKQALDAIPIHPKEQIFTVIEGLRPETQDTMILPRYPCSLSKNDLSVLHFFDREDRETRAKLRAVGA